MRRADLEHIIRAAADVSGESELVIVGSQAILAEHPNAPDPLLLSPEADVFPRHRPELADEIEGALGEGSTFHDTHDYYAHAVGPETAKAPEGWEDRLVPIKNANTRQATGWCLERHDLVISKLAAGREKDLRFAEVAIREDLVELNTLRRRAETVPLNERSRQRLEQTLERVIKRAGKGAA